MERLYFTTKIVSDDAGSVSCLAWRYGKPDRIGDVVEKGAFGDIDLPLPMLAFHDLKSPIGAWSEAIEDDDGLHLRGRVLVGKVAMATECHELVMSGGIRAVSVGFITKKSKPRKGGGRTISQAELIECSMVPVGMHPDARLTSAKSVIEALAIAQAITRATAALTAGTKK
ncbi:HK97 family phage prohead protease [Tardiphaga sp.]|jgi:HK97 family phage prohead protease|uniref:HK97 family phage prohead protease n=1 Tax=Tardiphaga sp. TaxID=1926292 RepID=UPI0037DA478E